MRSTSNAAYVARNHVFFCKIIMECVWIFDTQFYLFNLLQIDLRISPSKHVLFYNTNVLKCTYFTRIIIYRKYNFSPHMIAVFYFDFNSCKCSFASFLHSKIPSPNPITTNTAKTQKNTHTQNNSALRRTLLL